MIVKSNRSRTSSRAEGYEYVNPLSRWSRMEAISGSPSSSILRDLGVDFPKYRLLTENLFPGLTVNARQFSTIVSVADLSHPLKADTAPCPDRDPNEPTLLLDEPFAFMNS